MTPEEYAADVLQHYTHINGTAPINPRFLGRLIADAVATAVEAEREACAQIADVKLQEHVKQADANGDDGAQYHAALCFHYHQIAATIRRRTTPPNPRPPTTP